MPVFKLTFLGLLVYGAMSAYLAAFVALVSEHRKLGHGFFVAGFGFAAAGFVYRWFQVEHVPLQSLFEVFLCLGMLAYPISLFCRRFLDVGGEAGDALVAFVVLLPAGFVFKAEPQKLPPALQSWLFLPHVSAYMLSYMILAKAAVQGLADLFARRRSQDTGVSYELAAYRMVRLGFPLLTLGLVLGAWWGNRAWGSYWNWDPKELWSLVTWLVYLGYLHFRHMYGTRHRTVNSVLVVGGAVAIVVTLLWVNLASLFASGLHSYAS